MKTIILISFFTFLTDQLFCQRLENFLNAYNKHIDPYSKTDTIQFLKVTNYLIADFHNQSHVESSSECYYNTKGLQKCMGKNSNLKGSYDVKIPTRIKEEELIKYMLNFIFIKDRQGAFSITLTNDSITIIKEVVDQKNFNLYTFNSKNLNLLQMRSILINDGEELVRDTNFLTYITVDGILVPQTMKYSNKFFRATLEYTEVSFKKFQRSLFESD